MIKKYEVSNQLLTSYFICTFFCKNLQLSKFITTFAKEYGVSQN